MQLVPHAKGWAVAAVDATINSYRQALDVRNTLDYHEYLNNTSTGYERYRKVKYDESSSAKSEPTSKETQPPVSSALSELAEALSELAEEFTQLASLGKLTQMKKMVNEHTQGFENTSGFVNMQNERQQTVNLISAR